MFTQICQTIGSQGTRGTAHAASVIKHVHTAKQFYIISSPRAIRSVASKESSHHWVLRKPFADTASLQLIGGCTAMIQAADTTER